MVPLPQLNEADLDLLVSYPVGTEQTASDAIVDAFLAANVDVFRRDTPLEHWVDTDALEELAWSTRLALYVSTRIWNHKVVVTAEEIRIYTDPPVAQAGTDG